MLHDPKWKPNRKANEPTYAEAVAEAQKIVKELNDCQQQLRLGELTSLITDRAEHDDRTLAKFAKDVGVAACTLARYRSVYRAWKGFKKAPGLSYAVLRALQDHPNREQIVEDDPKITKRRAEELRREHKGKTKNSKSRNGKLNETKRWLNQVVSLNNDLKRINEEELQKILEPELLATLIPDLKEASEALRKIAEYLENQNEHLAEDVPA
jgi:hypothetical protein